MIDEFPQRDSVENRSERAEIVREDIFHKAISLFDKKGFSGTSMNDIAAICGVTKPTIYYYFKNKSDFLETLYFKKNIGFYEISEKEFRRAAPAHDRLRSVLRMLAVRSVDEQVFLGVLTRERRELSKETRAAVAKRERSYEASVKALIEEAQRDGAIAKADPDFMTLTIIGLLTSVYRWAKHYQKPTDEIADELLNLIFNGIIAATEKQDECSR